MITAAHDAGPSLQVGCFGLHRLHRLHRLYRLPRCRLAASAPAPRLSILPSSHACRLVTDATGETDETDVTLGGAPCRFVDAPRSVTPVTSVTPWECCLARCLRSLRAPHRVHRWPGTNHYTPLHRVHPITYRYTVCTAGPFAAERPPVGSDAALCRRRRRPAARTTRPRAAALPDVCLSAARGAIRGARERAQARPLRRVRRRFHQLGLAAPRGGADGPQPAEARAAGVTAV